MKDQDQPKPQLHQEHFEAWLMAQDPNRVIESADGTRCFLCSFVKETTQFKNAFMAGWMEWSPTGMWHDPVLLLPEWARKLINPEWCAMNGHCPAASITCGQMQQRYRELFPEKPITEPKPAAAEVVV